MDRAANQSRKPRSEDPQGPALDAAEPLVDRVAPEAPQTSAANADLIKDKRRLTHVGRYVLKAPLGEGGWGCVFEAWDPLLSRVVAVKTLQFGLQMTSRIVLDRLLLNEARAAANLNHRHIVTVHDAGLSAHGVYLAMECLKGRDMRRALDEGWRPTTGEALQLVRRVADALAYAHVRGVIHCDIKPGNIFLTRTGRPKVLDFGIARVANAKAVPELEGLLMGSPYYLSPEQLAGNVVDLRADIYSLGVVLYELLAGQKAFAGDSLADLREAVLKGRHTPLAELRPELPLALLELVASCMALDPDKRPASAQAMAAGLRRANDSDGDAPGPRSQSKQTPRASTPAKRRWGWNWRWAWSGTAMGVLTLGMVTGVQSSTNLPLGVQAGVEAPEIAPAAAAPALTQPAMTSPAPGSRPAASPAQPLLT